AEPVEQQVHQAGGGRLGDVVAPLQEASVGPHQQHYVLGGEVGPQYSGGVGALDESDESLERAGAQVLDVGGAGNGHGDEVGYAPVPGLHDPDRLDVGGEAVPRVRVGQAGLDRVEVLDQPVCEHRRDQVATVREPSIQRGVAGARPAGDVVQRGVEPLLGEHLPGGLDDGGPVAGGVCSQCHEHQNPT